MAESNAASINTRAYVHSICLAQQLISPTYDLVQEMGRTDEFVPPKVCVLGTIQDLPSLIQGTPKPSRATKGHQRPPKATPSHHELHLQGAKPLQPRPYPL